MIKCDFHTHSTASDGKLSPAELANEAKKREIKYLALTDHDTLSGIDTIKAECEKLDINFIPGVELSTTHHGESVHILGFFKGDDYKAKDLNYFLESLKVKRIERAKEIVKRLEEHYNIKIKVEDVLKNGKDTIARPHIARTIIEAGYDYTMEYIFDNYLGDNCKAFVPANKLSTTEGIQLLKDFNAAVFLAHPVLLKKLSAEELLELGFDGIEAIYGLNKPEDNARFINLADKKGILISCGSDSHGYEDTDVKHAALGSQVIHEDYLQRFLDKLDYKK